MILDDNDKEGWIDKEVIDGLVNKIKSGETLNCKEVILPTTTDIGEVISAAPHGYLDIYVEGCGDETFSFDTIQPYGMMTTIYLKRQIMLCEDEDDHFARYEIHDGEIWDGCSDKFLSSADGVKELNKLYNRVRMLERENFELIKKINTIS